MKTQINTLLEKANTTIKQKRRLQKLILYATGLEAKMKQAEFALSCLDTYESKSDSTVSSTTEETFTITDQVHFYCDSFWTFLYSSLDVLAQIINQALKLNFRERFVSFKKIAENIKANYPRTRLQKKLAACIKSNVFKNLDNYRNCSTHRRQIYIKEISSVVRHTSGYFATSTGDQTEVVRIICDNPLEGSPRVSQNRKIPKYMKDIQSKVKKRIEDILKDIQPI